MEKETKIKTSKSRMNSNFRSIGQQLSQLDKRMEDKRTELDNAPLEELQTAIHVAGSAAAHIVREQITAMLAEYRASKGITEAIDQVLPMSVLNYSAAQVWLPLHDREDAEESETPTLHGRYGIVIWLGPTPVYTTMVMVPHTAPIDAAQTVPLLKDADGELVTVPHSITLSMALETYGIEHVITQRPIGSSEKLVTFPYLSRIGEHVIDGIDRNRHDLVMESCFGIVLTAPSNGNRCTGIDATAVTCVGVSASTNVMQVKPIPQLHTIHTTSPEGLVSGIRAHIKSIAPAQAMVYGALESTQAAVSTARHQARLTTAALTSFTINESEIRAQKTAVKKQTRRKQQP